MPIKIKTSEADPTMERSGSVSNMMYANIQSNNFADALDLIEEDMNTTNAAATDESSDDEVQEEHKVNPSPAVF